MRSDTVRELRFGNVIDGCDMREDGSATLQAARCCNGVSFNTILWRYRQYVKSWTQPSRVGPGRGGGLRRCDCAHRHLCRD